MNTQRTTLAATAFLVLMGALLALRLTDAEAYAQGKIYDLSWWTVDGGGGMLSGGSYVLAGTTGQPDARPALGGGSYTLLGGFWPGAHSASTPLERKLYLPLVLRNGP